MTRALRIFFSIVAMWPAVLGAQTITAVSGPIVHGGAVTIFGSQFGIKSTPGPVVWDNFETGSFNPGWTGTGYPPGTLTVAAAGANARHANSAYNTTSNFAGTDGWATLSGGSDSPAWYAQYWFKLDSDWTWGTSSTQGAPNSNLANVKLFRMWSSGSVNENFVVAAHGWGGSGGEVIVTTENIGAQAAQFTEQNYITNWTKNEWHLWQFEFKDSGQGVADGVFRWWIDGSLKFETTNWITRSAFSNFKRVYGLGFFNSNGDSSSDSNHFYMDDAYIDNSWARVEIGNNINYNSCTHREIQIPTSWNTNQITISANKGSFTSGSPMYLFVVNANGQVSAGYPLTGGAPSPTPTLDALAPAAPTNLITD